MDKGHAEANESPEQTALRELYEETALTPAQLFKDKTYEQRYSFKYKDTTINRVIVYYAGIVAVPDFRIQEDELKNAGWFTCDDAREKLTFEQTKKMFDAVLTDRGIM